MGDLEREVLQRFKSLVSQRVGIHQMILFGSRSRGDADPESDMDVLVVLKGPYNSSVMRIVSDSAWEASFDRGIVVAPIVYSRDEWENSPERSSLLAQVVEREGIVV